jgi:hypothetical protein
MTLIPELQRDLVDAAGRLGRPRLRAPAGLVVALATAAAAVVAAVLLVANDGGGPDSRPADRVLPAPADGDRTTDPPITAPPRPSLDPVPGSQSPPLSLEFGGVRYTAVGFRSDGSAICTSLKAADGADDMVPPGGTGSCLSERLLRDALAKGRVHMYAGGGGGPTQTAGFARAEVMRLSLIDRATGDKVILSEPWRPEPWDGDPIRFVYVLSESPPETIPSFDRHRFEAELRHGEVVPAP